MAPRLASKLTEFGDLLLPEEALEPILAKGVRAALLEWLTEIWANDELVSVGLKPRKRALFHGVPGTGKTTLAHHLAARLGLDMLLVRPERFMSPYLNQDAAQVGALFQAVRAHDAPVFLFFDEFDTIAAKRMGGGLNQSAEQNHNNTINAVLKNLDAYDGFVVAATNLADRLDPAIWRRFDIQIEIDLPSGAERRRILARYLDPFQLPVAALEALSEALEIATPALIRQLCEGIKRQMIVGPKAGWAMGKEAVFERLIASVMPHPEAGKPRLWSHGIKDKALNALPWPLSKEAPTDVAYLPIEAVETVVPFQKKVR